MSSSPHVPPAFAGLVDLASDATGAFALHATDEYFAPKEALLRPGDPVFDPDAYTERGKLMDGWESARRRTPGHDWCIVRLGTPGRIHGLLVDTTHFKGNAPEAVALEGRVARYDATGSELGGDDGWFSVLARTAVQPDHRNVIALPSPSEPVSHVRLHIHPDGGVSRLRVYGTVEVDPAVFWAPGSLDLAAVENGGTIAAASDAFFSAPSNLLLPGRGVNMGSGWETRRRRSPGSDACVIRLGRRGIVERLCVDTHFFKGNPPQAVRVEALDAAALAGADGAPADLAPWLHGDAAWPLLLVPRTTTVAHHRHTLRPDRPLAVTHLRLHMHPHGGVNRVRAFGHALDTPTEAARLATLNAMGEGELRSLLLSFNGAPAFAEAVLQRAPFDSVRSLFAAVEAVWWALGEADWLAAFAAHPVLGETARVATQTAASAAMSAREQSALAVAGGEVRARLAEQNAGYRARHGFIFILSAEGRSAEQVLERLDERIDNDRATELDQAAREQARITRARLGRWLLQAP